MKDWMVRSIKTFVQAFFGPVILELCAILANKGFPESWSVLWALLAPAVSAALAAGICAVWNIILEAMKEDEAPCQLGFEVPDPDDEEYLGKH